MQVQVKNRDPDYLYDRLRFLSGRLRQARFLRQQKRNACNFAVAALVQSSSDGCD